MRTHKFGDHAFLSYSIEMPLMLITCPDFPLLHKVTDSEECDRHLGGFSTFTECCVVS